MAIDTSARRTSRTAALSDTIEDVVIDIEDAVAKMTLTEGEQLIGKIKQLTANVVIDPASIASGKAPLALGAGPASTPTDPKQAFKEGIAHYATERGFNSADVVKLLALLDTAEKLTNATSAAEGLTVSQVAFKAEQSKAAQASQRIREIEDHLGVSADSLDPAKKDYKRVIDAVRPTLPAPATTTGLDPAKKATIKSVLDKVKASTPGFRGKRTVEIADADIDAALSALS